MPAERWIESAVEMLAAGVRWLQLRAKRLSSDQLASSVERLLASPEAAGADIWVNDRADVAALFPVAGVHLGQTDLPPGAARRVVGRDRWIGLSTHSVDQVEAADGDSAVDVVAVGPVFATATKRDAEPVVGLDLVRRARALTTKPLVAIGGIDADRLPEVLAAGADSIALIGGVGRGDVGTNCRRLLQRMEAL